MRPLSFLRIKDVLKRFPVSKTTWYTGIQEGIYPKPVKLTKRTSAWRSTDIDSLIHKISEAGGIQ